MQWALYELSRHPTIQQQLHKEITTVAPLGKLPTHDDLQKMPFLKAIIKEVLRYVDYYYTVNGDDVER